MDRRTWLQLLGLLSAVPAAAPQQPPAAPAGGGPTQPAPPPMRIKKEQVTGALALLGLDFQDGEVDMMMRRVNAGLSSYENLRKIDVPYGTEPAFAFHPGLPGRVPAKGPQRFLPTAAPAHSRPPNNLEQ